MLDRIRIKQGPSIKMTEPRRSSMETAMEELISTYHELNGSHVDELAELPTPLEFMQYVRRGRPLVIRGAVSEWPAMQWTAEYLETEMRGSRVQIAMTPSGFVRSEICSKTPSVDFILAGLIIYYKKCRCCRVEP